jgi:hypothetical protein
MMPIEWATVGSIIESVVARLRSDDPLDGLRLIGVDELSHSFGFQGASSLIALITLCCGHITLSPVHR